jgi:FkbM family methyltransferase
MIDYSQWGEQQIILDYFGDHVGTFLDLGAYDGVEGSNTRALDDRGWKGALIEASPFNFTKLIENRLVPEIVCVNAAVMPHSGLVHLADTNSQLTSATDGAGYLYEYVQREYWIAAITPDDIVKTLGSKWDFVSIDIEGADFGVLSVAGNLLSNTRLLCFEDALPFTAFSQAYYDSVLALLSGYGFTKIIGRTTIEGRSANTLIARP